MPDLAEYKYNGETYLLDDSDGSSLRVMFKDVSGILTIDPTKFPSPYRTTIKIADVREYGFGHATFQEAIEYVCETLPKVQDIFQGYLEFDNEAASNELRQFVQTVRSRSS